jgi:hypothetical protein
MQACPHKATDASVESQSVCGKNIAPTDTVELISQSPDDFETVEDNFLEQIGLTACFRSNSTSPQVLRACLGQTVDLAGLPDGAAVTRLPGQSGVTRVKAWE